MRRRGSVSAPSDPASPLAPARMCLTLNICRTTVGQHQRTLGRPQRHTITTTATPSAATRWRCVRPRRSSSPNQSKPQSTRCAARSSPLRIQRNIQNFPLVAIAAVSTRQLLVGERDHVTQPASHAGSTTERSRAFVRGLAPVAGLSHKPKDQRTVDELGLAAASWVIAAAWILCAPGGTDGGT